MSLISSIAEVFGFIDEHKIFIGMSIGWGYRIFSQPAVIEWFGFEVRK